MLSYYLMSEQIMFSYLATCFIGFFLIVCSRGMLQVGIMFTWLLIMAYLSVVHFLIRNYLTSVSLLQ